MRKTFFIMALGALVCSCSQPAEQTADYQVVPLPQVIDVAADASPFVLKSSTKIAVANDSLIREAQFLQEYVADLTGHQLKIEPNADKNVIRVEATLDNSNPDAYQISVDKDQIVINGATNAGTFYGIQTLRKAIPEQLIPSNVAFPAGMVAAAPRFGYRGAHLDIARHPMEVDSVKSFIDMIAMHGINKFHWHLTDDQGWRIEIKKYPKLAEIASYRPGTMVGNNWEEFDTIPVSGCLTQEQAKDIVRYAAECHIQVIPEIDLPGHMVAALEAYPELGCTGGPYKAWQKWGISKDLLCAGNDSTYIFLDDILNEICDIFPSQMVHIGGDECPKDRWKECKKCQAKIKELGLKSDKNSSAEEKLQSYVMARAMETLSKRGRRAIGWDEILEGGATGDVVIMSWRGTEGAEIAAKSGHDAILTPVQYCYFDYCQGPDRESEPVSIGGYLPVEKVYNFEPISPEFTPEEAAHILGVQANLWREYIKTLSHSQYMELPRLAALSEVQWLQPEQKNYDQFVDRARRLTKHYDAAGYNYARHIFQPTDSIAQ
ncbi:MAG: beta-N-acetylhexosaminidase [Bacteroidales bacterium]|nr:beta-N-acetylhexosaminidase [Bacteroidales bacterium]